MGRSRTPVTLPEKLTDRWLYWVVGKLMRLIDRLHP